MQEWWRNGSRACTLLICSSISAMPVPLMASCKATLVEVNYVNENFCLSFTQKFATDRYVKAFRELLEQYGIACTEIEETKFI